MGMDSGRPVQPIATEPGIVGRRFPGNLKILSDIALLEFTFNLIPFRRQQFCRPACWEGWCLDMVAEAYKCLSLYALFIAESLHHLVHNRCLFSA
jgi:hypothetical protein